MKSSRITIVIGSAAAAALLAVSACSNESSAAHNAGEQPQANAASVDTVLADYVPEDAIKTEGEHPDLVSKAEMMGYIQDNHVWCYGARPVGSSDPTICSSVETAKTITPRKYRLDKITALDAPGGKIFVQQQFDWNENLICKNLDNQIFEYTTMALFISETDRAEIAIDDKRLPDDRVEDIIADAIDEVHRKNEYFCVGWIKLSESPLTFQEVYFVDGFRQPERQTPSVVVLLPEGTVPSLQIK